MRGELTRLQRPVKIIIHAVVNFNSTAPRAPHFAVLVLLIAWTKQGRQCCRCRQQHRFSQSRRTSRLHCPVKNIIHIVVGWLEVVNGMHTARPASFRVQNQKSPQDVFGRDMTIIVIDCSAHFTSRSPQGDPSRCTSAPLALGTQAACRTGSSTQSRKRRNRLNMSRGRSSCRGSTYRPAARPAVAD